MGIFFIADMHFGAEALARRRGFDNAAAMDARIVEHWRKRVSDDDAIWIVGDVGEPGLLSSLPGRKHLVLGNTDTPISRYRSCSAIANIVKSSMFEIADKSLLLIHRPEDAGERHVDLVVHGHIHHRVYPNPRFVCVSVDQTDWAPITGADVLHRARHRENLPA